ncbi:MAG: hypothetical protein ACR2FS_19630 [Phormidesmis sp.]
MARLNFKRPSTIFWGAIALATFYLSGCQPQEVANSTSEQRPSVAPPAPLSMPPPPPPGAYLAKVPPSVLNQLQGLPVMAPAYVPDGFTLAEHDAAEPNAYRLVYRSAADQCFAIEYVGPDQSPAGLSADKVATLSVTVFDSPVFGRDRQIYYSLPPQDRPQGSTDNPSEVVSQWLTNSQGFYRLVGASYIAKAYPAQTDCQNVSLSETVKITASLTELTVSPTDLLQVN